MEISCSFHSYRDFYNIQSTINKHIHLLLIMCRSLLEIDPWRGTLLMHESNVVAYIQPNRNYMKNDHHESVALVAYTLN